MTSPALMPDEIWIDPNASDDDPMVFTAEFFGGVKYVKADLQTPAPSSTSGAFEVQEYKADRFKEAYEAEKEKFQRETLRTSEYANLLQRIYDRLYQCGCRAEDWPKKCPTCELMTETKDLLARPINKTSTPAPEGVTVVTVPVTQEQIREEFIIWNFDCKMNDLMFHIFENYNVTKKE